MFYARCAAVWKANGYYHFVIQADSQGSNLAKHTLKFIVA